MASVSVPIAVRRSILWTIDLFSVPKPNTPYGESPRRLSVSHSHLPSIDQIPISGYSRCLQFDFGTNAYDFMMACTEIELLNIFVFGILRKVIL